MIYAKYKILELLRENMLQIKNLNQQNINPFSIDLTIAKLYEYQEDETLKEISLNSPFTLEPLKVYFFEPQEQLKINTNSLEFRVVTRSSAARLGIKVSDAKGTEYRKQIHHSDNFSSYLFLLQTAGTKVKIRHGDSFAQIIFADHTSYLIGTHKDGHGQKITLSKNILLYDNKTTLNLSNPSNNNQAFKKIKIPFTGLNLKAGSFFIARSKQYIKIPPQYLGYISIMPDVTASPNFKKITPIITHSESPFIGHVGIFEGYIMFENQVLSDCKIKQGMKLSSLTLLQAQGTTKTESRYNKQNHPKL